MESEALRNAITARPFEPFDIVLPDGGSVPVRHPEYIAYSGGRTALVFLDEKNYERIDVGLITRLSVRPTPDAPAFTKPAQTF